MPADRHVLPVNDLYEHTESRLCWCVPKVLTAHDEITVVVVHRSADGREEYEEGALPKVVCN